METSIKQIVGTNIKTLRSKMGLSQEKFAKLCGLDRTYIASVELGRRNISIINLEKIATGLNVPVSELLKKESSILLNINGIRFLLKSTQPLSEDEKDDLEYICRCAFDEDSVLLQEDEDVGVLQEKSPYELAELFTLAAKNDGITVRFCPIDLEISIQE